MNCNNMRIFLGLLLAACMLVSAKGYTQLISLYERNAPIDQVFRNIEKQSGYLFWYELPLLKTARPVNINANNLSITQALDLCLKDQPLMYTIVGKTIVITKKKASKVLSRLAPPVTEFASDTTVSSLDEVVFVGYGSFSKRNISGSVASVSSRSISTQPVSSVDLAIAGQAAGVYV